MNTLKTMLAMLDYIFGKTNYHKIEIALISRCGFTVSHVANFCVQCGKGELQPGEMFTFELYLSNALVSYNL